MCRLFWRLWASASWNPQGLSRPVMELLCPLTFWIYPVGIKTTVLNVAKKAHLWCGACVVGSTSRCSNPGRGKSFSFLQNVHSNSGDYSVPPVRWVPGFSPRGWLGHETIHSCPSSTKVKNEWSCTSIPPVSPHCVDMDSITFAVTSYLTTVTGFSYMSSVLPFTLVLKFGTSK